MDQSHLDRKYFIDNEVYNCPFCNRNNLKYKIIHRGSFDRNNNKVCFYYIVKCSSCGKVSLHLSYNDISIEYTSGIKFRLTNKETDKEIEIDDNIFYHQPTSFFVIDSRINEKIRNLISEAEWCLKMDYLVWASACLRKAIYELIALEKAESFRENWYVNYEASIKKLKTIFPDVQGDLFDAMSEIQELVSDNIHEKSWGKRDSENIKNITLLLKEILYEMYVIPAQRKERFKTIPLLKKEIIQDKKMHKEIS